MARRVPGEGSIYKHVTRRKDGSERVRYRFVLGGRTYTYRTPTEARAAAKKAIADRDAGVRADRTLTTAAYLDRWFREVKAVEGVSPNTLTLYRAYLDRKVIPVLGRTRLADVTTPQVQTLLAGLITAGYAPATVSLIRSMISGAFEYARRARLIPVNPVRDTVPPRVPKARKLAPSAVDAVALLARFPDPPWQAFVTLGLCYGLRISEILGLRWQDVTDTTITVRGQLGRNGGAWTPRRKADGDDLVLPTVPPVARALARHRAALDQIAPLVFTRPDGKPYTQQQAYDAFRRRVRGSGLPFRTPHDMRHANNSLADELGVDLATRMIVLGHRNAATNERYSHTSPARVRAALERIAGALEPEDRADNRPAAGS
ncbi:MAG: tyrosine-type recombinase/integrase [Dehalococcoidia bacterium]